MRIKFLFALLLISIAAFGQQNPVQIDANGLTQTLTAGGVVTRGQIVKINSAGQVVPVATTDTSGAIGVAATSQTSAGNGIAVSIAGTPLVQIDSGGCAAGNFVLISTIGAGSGHCSTTSGSGQVGVAISISSPGSNFWNVALTLGGGGGTLASLVGPLTFSATAYGVKADAVHVLDASWTNTLNTVTCPNNDCNFVAATDNNKMCWGNGTITGNNSMPVGTLTVTGAQSATCSTATATVTGNGEFVWGTDDTAAWLKLRTDYYNSQRAAFIEGPGGHTIVTAPPLLDSRCNTAGCVMWNASFQSPAGMTIFMPSPTFDFTKCATVLGGDGGCMWDTDPTGGSNQNNLPQYQKLQNFGIDGSSLTNCAAGANNKILTSFRRVEGANIWLWNWCSGNGGTGALVTAPNSFYNLNMNSFGTTCMSTVGGGANALTWLVTSYVGQTCTTGISVGSGSNVISKGSYWLGCLGQCISIQAGGFMTMDGDQLNGASGNQYVDVFGTLFMINNVQEIATNNSGHAILTRATGKAYIRGSTIKETGTGGIAFNVNLVPGGSIINEGDNTIVGIDQTALTASMIVLSAGWGTTATVTAPTGTPSSNPTRFSFQVNSAGTGQAANPTMAFTYPNVGSTPTWTCKQVGGTGTLTIISGEGTATSTTMTLTFNGTPVAASNYIITCTGALQ